jgi:hypothetical protein
MTTLPPSMSRLSRENVGTSTSDNPTGLHGLLQGYLYFLHMTYRCIATVCTHSSPRNLYVSRNLIRIFNDAVSVVYLFVRVERGEIKNIDGDFEV